MEQKMLILLFNLIFYQTLLAQDTPPQWINGAIVMKCPGQIWMPLEALDDITFKPLAIRENFPTNEENLFSDFNQQQVEFFTKLRPLLNKQEIVAGDYNLGTATDVYVPPECEAKFVGKILKNNDLENYRVFYNTTLMSQIDPKFYPFIKLRTSAAIMSSETYHLSVFFRGLFLRRPVANYAVTECKKNLVCQWAITAIKIGLKGTEVNGLPYDATYTYNYSDATATVNSSFKESYLFFNELFFKKSWANISCGADFSPFQTDREEIIKNCNFNIAGRTQNPGKKHSNYLGMFNSWQEPHLYDEEARLLFISKTDNSGSLSIDSTNTETSEVILKDPFLGFQDWQVNSINWDQNKKTTAIVAITDRTLTLNTPQLPILVIPNEKHFFSYSETQVGKWVFSAQQSSNFKVKDLSITGVEELNFEKDSDFDILFSGKKGSGDLSPLFLNKFMKSRCETFNKFKFYIKKNLDYVIETLNCISKVTFPDSKIIKNYEGEWTFRGYYTSTHYVDFKTPAAIELGTSFNFPGVIELHNLKSTISQLTDKDYAKGSCHSELPINFFNVKLNVKCDWLLNPATTNDYDLSTVNLYELNKGITFKIPAFSKVDFELDDESEIAVYIDRHEEGRKVYFKASVSKIQNFTCSNGQVFVYNPLKMGTIWFSYSEKKGLIPYDECPR